MTIARHFGSAGTVPEHTSAPALPRLIRTLLQGLVLLGMACAAPLAAQNIPTGSPLDPALAARYAAMQQAQQGNEADPRDPRSDPADVPAVDAGTDPVFRSTVVSDPAAARSTMGTVTTQPYTLQEMIRAQQGLLDKATRMKAPPLPGEFEKYVARVVGKKLPRFGQDLILPAQRDFAAPANASVPPDYRLNPGDVLTISMTGAVEGSVDREIDTQGNIFLPSVGSVRLAGVRFADVRSKISGAIGTQFRDYGVAVMVKRLRGIRVYVTGFANNPGAFTMSSLSTMANAVFQAGGPSAGGSLRSVKLYREGRQAADLDLYQLLRGGSRVRDAVLQNEDVLFIPPAGDQVAVIGSVQHEAIYEAKPGESLEQTLAAAGGPNVLGDTDRLILYRTSDTTTLGPREILRSEAMVMAAAGGDIIQVLSRGSLLQPVARQHVVVRIEGEVAKPGNYYVDPNTPMQQVLDLAGGLTTRAFPFGTKLVRQSVREQQREGFEDALRQLEVSLASAPLTASSSLTAEERNLQLAGAREVFERLRKAEPDGRVVIGVTPQSTTVPGTIMLENNDQIVVPPRASTVGVFGAVYRPASFLIEGRPLRVKDYLDRAGGPQRAADKSNIFVVRANGEVLTKSNGAIKATAVPGDVIFVPVKTSASNFWAKLRDISSIIFQTGVTAAAVAAIGN